MKTFPRPSVDCSVGRWHEWILVLYVCAYTCESGEESEAADCSSESSLFINSWVILYAFGGKVERSRPKRRRRTQRGDGLILQVLMNARKVGARGSSGGRERRAPGLESLVGIEQRRQQDGVCVWARVIVVAGWKEYNHLKSNPWVHSHENFKCPWRRNPHQEFHGNSIIQNLLPQMHNKVSMVSCGRSFFDSELILKMF